MKKKHIGAWIAGGLALAGAGVGVWWYERHYGPPTATLAPGAMTAAHPSNGTASLALPAGAKAWQSATLNLGTAPSVPSSPSAHLLVTVAAGTVVTATWTDSTGATQTSVVTFT